MCTYFQELKIKVYRGKCEPIIKGKLLILRLHENCLESSSFYTFLELDKEDVIHQKEKLSESKCFIDKQNIIGIDNTFYRHPDDDSREKIPVVIVYVTGTMGEIWLRCETFEISNTIFNALTVWKFNQTVSV